MSENIPSWHGLCLHGHRLCRDIAVVLIASILRSGYLTFIVFFVKLETGDSQDLKYGVYRIKKGGSCGCVWEGGEGERGMGGGSEWVRVGCMCVVWGGGEGRRGGGGGGRRRKEVRGEDSGGQGKERKGTGAVPLGRVDPRAKQQVRTRNLESSSSEF